MFHPYAFATKTAARRALQDVLYRYPPGTTVTGTDVDFLAAVVACHPERDVKIGAGVASFQVEQNDGSRGFWLTRIDGTRTDWSFYACLTPPSAAAEATAGFRSEIRSQIEAFKDEAFNRGDVRCEITDEPLVRATAHVDHARPFNDLLRSFLFYEALNIAEVSVDPTRDGETETRLADRALAARWSSFHADEAVLRLVSQRANLSLLRRT
jgi:hypothetical protein